jgi:hypothetical protein
MEMIVYGDEKNYIGNETSFKALDVQACALMYHPFLYLKRIINVIFASIVYFDLVLYTGQFRYRIFEEMMFVLILIAYLNIEVCWFTYLLYVRPFKMYSQNRIEIINQFLLIGYFIAGVWIIVKTSESSDITQRKDLAYITTSIFMFPISYIIIGIHVILIKS